VTASNNRLLVTEDAPAYGVLAAVRALRGAGYRPWLAVTGRDAYSLRSRACAGVVTVPDPREDRDEYLAAIVRAAERLNVAAVMPGTDLGLLALSSLNGSLPDQIAFGVVDPDTVRRATDKMGLEALAAQARLHTPVSVHCTAEDIEAGVAVPLPALVKPTRTRTPTASGGFATSVVRTAESREELLRAVRSVPGDVAVVQQRLEGPLTASCGVAWQGEVVAMAHQVSRRIFPPGNGITAFAESVEPDADVEAGVRQLMRMLSWSGIFQVQFVRAGETSYLIDLNPRIYGSLALTVAAGLNLPAIWADLLLGRAPRVGGYKVGVRFRSEERELAGLAASIAGRDWRTAFEVLRPRRRTTHALGSFSDPVPLLMNGRWARIRRLSARKGWAPAE
jgi:predicted ATP-grasp superfamily ATP-dependent carboligase